MLICPGCGALCETEWEYLVHKRDCPETTAREKTEARWRLQFERRAGKEHQRQILALSVSLCRPHGSA